MNWLIKIASLEDLLQPKGKYPGVGTEKGFDNKNGISVYLDEFGSQRYVLYENGVALCGMQVMVGRDKPLISNIFTHPDSRRQGLAKLVYQRIKKDFPDVEFSTDRSELGEALVDGIN